MAISQVADADTSSAELTNWADMFLAHDVILPTRKLAVFAAFKRNFSEPRRGLVYHRGWVRAQHRFINPNPISTPYRRKKDTHSTTAFTLTHNVISPLEPGPALRIHPRTSASSPRAGCNLPTSQAFSARIRRNHAANRTAPRLRNCPTSSQVWPPKRGRIAENT